MARIAMEIDRLALRLRTGSPAQASDLGVRLCQESAGDAWRCHLAVLAPVAALSMASVELAPWLPALLLWWAKPWLDRTLLFVLARSAFGMRTSLRDLWAAQRQVWWSQLLRTFTLRRLSASRSYTQPIHQLEGQSGAALRRRLRELRRGRTGAARMLTFTFSNVEFALYAGLVALALMLAPTGHDAWDAMLRWYTYSPRAASLWVGTVPYAIAIAFLEPFYVAAGFGMYLSRRVELEAWDIEQELRHAFAQ
jgi:hypothetical protein